MKILAMMLVALPFFASALMALVSSRGDSRISPTYQATAHGASLIATGLTVICGVVLLSQATDSTLIIVEWLPGTGSMELSASPAKLYLLLVTTASAFLVFLGGASYKGEYSLFSGAVTMLALAAANAAFLAEHFLARYVALEVVALCIVLVLVLEIRSALGIRMAWNSYLLLRMGDVGLLIAILTLMAASGTLDIGPALAAAGSLDATQLIIITIGFLLAVWVKLGGWPFHLWSQAGRKLTPTSQAWLYATLLPNLGLYLLYRIAPLLSLVRSLETTALWLGAGGATIAALAALMQEDLRAALAYLGAVQGGLVLFAAGSGVQAAIWLSVLVLTPLRLLFFLGSDMVPNLDSPMRRKVATAFLGIGELTLVGFNLLTTWWARKANAPLDALFVVETAVALNGIWAVRTVWQLVRHPSSVGQKRDVGWVEWLTVGGLSTAMVVGGVGLRPLARHLEAVCGMALPTIPALPTLLHYSATTPAMLAVMVLLLGIWQLQRRSKPGPLLSAEPVEQTYDLEDGLARAARALYAVIEVGILERTLLLVVRGVVEGAQLTYRIVEQEGLEGFLLLVVRGVVEGAQLTYRVVEQEGLEGFLQRSVQAVLAVNRGLQRWHTGKLRYNLLWISLTLALAWCILLRSS